MSDIVTTDTGDAAAADADQPRDDTDVLFRDDVDDADDLPTRASRRIVTAWTVVFAALLIAGAGLRRRHPDGEAQRACRQRGGRLRRIRPERWASPARAARPVASPVRMARPVASPARTVLPARRPVAVPQARLLRRRAAARPVRSSSSTARTSTSRRATDRR